MHRLTTTDRPTDSINDMHIHRQQGHAHNHGCSESQVPDLQSHAATITKVQSHDIRWCCQHYMVPPKKRQHPVSFWNNAAKYQLIVKIIGAQHCSKTRTLAGCKDAFDAYALSQQLNLKSRCPTIFNSSSEWTARFANISVRPFWSEGRKQIQSSVCKNQFYTYSTNFPSDFWLHYSEKVKVFWGGDIMCKVLAGRSWGNSLTPIMKPIHLLRVTITATIHRRSIQATIAVKKLTHVPLLRSKYQVWRNRWINQHVILQD